MPVVKNKSTEENREFWSHVEAIAKEVEKWPNWTDGTIRENKPEESVRMDCPAGNDNCAEK